VTPAAGAAAGAATASVIATLDRLQAVEPRTAVVREPIVGTARRADCDPVVREALGAAVAQLTAAIGTDRSVGALAEELPDPATRDAVAALALVSALPAACAWVVERGVPEQVAWASVADVPRKLAVYGLHGTGVDWLSGVVAGRVLTVGRLQFERDVRVPAAGGELAGAPAWGVHIPEIGPLDPDACDDAFERAPALLEALTGTRAAAWTCTSWLLDPRLGGLLGPEANIVRFAGRFMLLPAVVPDPADTLAVAVHDAEADAGIGKFVFGASSLAEARRRRAVGRLQLGVLAHLDAGGHWYERDGVAPVARG